MQLKCTLTSSFYILPRPSALPKHIHATKPLYARSLSNLGTLNQKTGNYEKAEPLYLEAIPILEKTLGKEDTEYSNNLNNLATSLGSYDDSNLLIAGHTDAIGSSDYNQNLSERRAGSAARYLAAHGVARYVATAGLVEREPVASNTTEAGRDQNRRIEIAIYASATLQEDARRQAASR